MVVVTGAWIELNHSIVFNLRDVGGLPTAGGGVTRAGWLYRSDSLGQLAEADREAFAALGVQTLIDLRRAAELDEYGRAPAWACANWRHIPLDYPPWRAEDYSAEVGVVAYLVDRYLEIVELAATGVVAAVRLIADPASGPTLVHCLGGRDRTGVVVALVLSLVGVDEDTIAADYARTESATARYEAWARVHRPAEADLPDYLARCPEAAIRGVLRELTDRYGSVAGYLVAHGLTPDEIAALRAKLRTSDG